MKLKYIGETFGAMSLTNGKIYECLSIKPEFDLLEVIDDSGGSYTYPIINPRPLTGNSKGGIWEIVEDKNDLLQKCFTEIKK